MRVVSTYLSNIWGVSLKPEPVILPETFEYNTIISHRYEMPEFGDYRILHTNGFIKLATVPGRKYWLSQSQPENQNRNPDWKIHFSIQKESIPQAWDILAQLFIEEKCTFAMKVCYGDFPEHMRGREITVYIYRHHSSYEVDDLKKEDEQPASFWKRFIALAEERLEQNEIKSNGTAEGDKPLGGMYASLRNEAFVPYNLAWKVPSSGLTGLDRRNPKLEGQLVYPPNDAGYNAAGHEDPLEEDYDSSWCIVQ